MIDFSDDLGKTDIVLYETSLYKIRNIVKTAQGENPYAPMSGTDWKELTTNFSGTQRFSRSGLAQKFFAAHCDTRNLSFSSDAQGLSIRIDTQKEPFL